MNANDVSKLVIQEIDGRISLPNSHGVDLKPCLVTPILIPVINRSVRQGKREDFIERVWLVLEEKPFEKDGYKIVFNEQRQMFGLASCGFDTDLHPVLCGYYGDFRTTLAGM